MERDYNNDNHSNQLNPNNDEYYNSRGISRDISDDDDDYDDDGDVNDGDVSDSDPFGWWD